MHFYSPYRNMTQDAAHLPQGQNVKLFMRHSIREDNPVNGDYEPLMLTKEGIALAQQMGRSIDCTIGFCGTSRIGRCIQTVQELTGAVAPAYCPQQPHITVLAPISGCLGNPQAKERGGVGWYEYFHYLQEGETSLTNNITLRQEASPYLDCLFAHGGTANTLDLFCTHDCCVVILASALFGLQTGIHGENWCGYTEGLFLSGTRDHFTAWWRGEQKSFDHFE